MLKDLVRQAAGDAAALEDLVAAALPNMPPRLVLQLRQVDETSAVETAVQTVATALRAVLDTRLASSREVLKTLLEAGEIRKLDSEIGKAARTGQLDMAFFTVLQMNLQDATIAETVTDEEGSANRVQILQHIYTRCQEEVEKMVPGGVALLNKLLRTEVDSIRTNQLQHYLCPQPNVIKSPDGKEIQLEGSKAVLVPPSELVDAMASAVQQVRTIEKAGGMDRASAASVVESMRQVAIQARLVIGENYGGDSDELKSFEDALFPVFRPSSPESPYIQGN